MGYYFKGTSLLPADSEDYWKANSALGREGFFSEVKTFSELKRRLERASPFLPLGMRVKIERVYRMVRGYEPGKPRSGSVDQETVLRLKRAYAGYDPKLGRARPAQWVKES